MKSANEYTHAVDEVTCAKTRQLLSDMSLTTGTRTHISSASGKWAAGLRSKIGIALIRLFLVCLLSEIAPATAFINLLIASSLFVAQTLYLKGAPRSYNLRTRHFKQQLECQ